MTASEQSTINEVKVVQATMKEHQRNMQNDIDELKQLVKQTNDQIATLNQKFDELNGAKRFLIWFTTLALTVSGLIIAWLNSHKP